MEGETRGKEGDRCAGGNFKNCSLPGASRMASALAMGLWGRAARGLSRPGKVLGIEQ